MNKTTEKFTDESIMPFGEYQGQAMANVPAKYLVYLLDNNKVKYGPVFDYIEDNLDILRYQAAKGE